ncbi:extracellular solute-binding protein [Devosia submarina]|uniref:extracellular solute-binding protein n=1 Tax=Devosia submarina TaxID=1173082 RepID=UPI000D3BE9AE|nr:extracellular solute-binding protein [Devosia submarina]
MRRTLKGMTWSHPRGYDPMVATSRVWKEKTGTEITWDKRSLQDFESFPVEELARQYDFIVIDHPHVGQITKEQCLLPLDVPGRDAERAEMSAHSVGGSYLSYQWNSRQWAFPIDAAAQVQAFRPDLLAAPVRNWNEVIELAQAGRVILPMRPPHGLMSFFTLAANIGTPCATTGPGPLIAPEVGAQVIALLRAVTDHIDPTQFEMDPIAASEAMAQPDSPYAIMPLGYGYLSYALQDFRPRRLKFSDIPSAGENGAVGSAVGGTGIAVSAFTKHPEAAIDYAYWVASAEVQKSIYAQAGGQPGHGIAWDDEAVNAPVDNFYRDTRHTLEHGYIRPRHDGYMAFQDAASQRLNVGLKTREPAEKIVADLNTLFAESF